METSAFTILSHETAVSNPDEGDVICIVRFRDRWNDSESSWHARRGDVVILITFHVLNFYDEGTTAVIYE